MQNDMPKSLIKKAASIIKKSKNTIIFTGAGISVESGIPPFRGENGLWSQYDPSFIELGYFHNHPQKSWEMIKKIFYDFIGKAKPNPAHIAIAELEKHGYIKIVITQNIDNLHQEAGCKTVYEFHGTTRNLLCLKCGKKYPSTQISLEKLPPYCPECHGLLKPDFVFFSEQIPLKVSELSFAAAEKAEVMLLVGTTGEVMPASFLPYTAKEKNNATIIEINPSDSAYTHKITDIYLQGRAGEILPELVRIILQP